MAGVGSSQAGAGAPSADTEEGADCPRLALEASRPKTVTSTNAAGRIGAKKSTFRATAKCCKNTPRGQTAGPSVTALAHADPYCPPAATVRQFVSMGRGSRPAYEESKRRCP